MATYLQENVLGNENVTGIYTLEPMTHLQTASNYPDMAALETIQQFALLNHITISSAPNGATPFARQQLSAECIVCACASSLAQRSRHAADSLPQLPGSRFQ